MSALWKHPKVRAFFGVSTLLGIMLLVLQTLGLFTRVDQAILNSSGLLYGNLFLDTGILLCFSLFPGFLIIRFGSSPGFLFTILCWMGYLALASWVGQPYQIAFPLTSAGIATGLSILSVIDWHGSFLDREKADINRLFGGFLEPETLDNLVWEPTLLITSGMRKTVTMLFVDIRGFMAIADTLPPDQLLDMLHSYFRYMIPIVQRHGGTVNKLVGDGIVAFFGDPVPQTDHAERAALAALAMQRAMEVIAQEWARHGLQDVNIGIGIHSGSVVAGDTGPDAFTSYTVLGRNVSLASQIEAACSDGEIYLSQATYTLLRERFSCEPLGELVFKHMQAPVPVYRLLHRLL
jgi:class 3 adenylate cyclase